MMVIKMLLKVMKWELMMMNGGGFRIEIGRDTAAFFPDLKFRFLVMHYIRTNNTC